MGLVLRMFSAAGTDQSIAVHRADILSFQGLHDLAGEADGHEFQYRSVVFDQLAGSIASALDPACLSFPKQRWIYPRIERRELLLGHADDQRLRHELPDRFL